MNKLILMGRLTGDPVIRYSREGNMIASFSLAVDRKYKKDGEKDADFFNCIGFGKLAEFIQKYLIKGTKVLLEGRLQNNNYTTQEGNKVYSMNVILESVEFCERKKAQENPAQGQPAPQTDDDGFLHIPEDGIEDEELPFE